MPSPLIRAEVDLFAIDHNIKEIRRIAGPDVKLLAAVKANAYGHGALRVSRQVLESGADMLGVARINEGIDLRQSGITAPILIMGNTPPEFSGELMYHDLTAAVSSCETAEKYARAARLQKDKIRVHLKIDTGMGRNGFLADGFRIPGSGGDAGLPAEIESICRLDGLYVEGIFSHFAGADAADKSSANRQFKIFSELLGKIEKSGIEIPIRHMANSAAIIDMPHTHLDMVRPGISVYGLRPSSEVQPDRIDLKPAMAVKARIAHLKNVGAGFKVSYGGTHTTSAPTRIAVIPVGYADGYSRQLSSRGRMLVHGQYAPITGRICMDLTMIDVGHIPGVKLDDEVVIIGRQGAEELSADEIAAELKTINYEIVSAIAARVPRVYPS
ncbi:MAG: alanine racemase [Desulfobacteraceae bacterium 4572_123]|nr:MAG: alanine racemase [Desulfobacteraceae bacterium 4572_123]